MRTATAVLLGLFLVLAAGSAIANCPLHGIYDMNTGTLDTGRAAESEPGGQSGEIGNAIKAGSFTDPDFGAQWILSCPAICVAPVLMENTVDEYGNGIMVYFTEYCGGNLWLNGPGEAWDNGYADYTAILLQVNLTVTLTIEGGSVVGHDTVIDVIGQFEGCVETCFYLYAQATQMGAGYGYEFPAGYPLPVYETSCQEDANLSGTYWDITGGDMLIDYCTTASQDSDWGQVKTRY